MGVWKQVTCYIERDMENAVLNLPVDFGGIGITNEFRIHLLSDFSVCSCKHSRI